MRSRWTIAVALSATLLAVLSVWPLASESRAQNEPPAAQAPVRAPRRLPAYYARVVTPQQRVEIYAIQEEYSAQIAELEAQLQELEAQRDAEIRQVLSAEQQEQLDALIAAARERRRSGTTASGSSGGTSTTAGAAATDGSR